MITALSRFLFGCFWTACLALPAAWTPVAGAHDWHWRPPYGWYPPPPIYVMPQPVYPVPPPAVYYPRWPQVTIGLPPLVFGIPFGGHHHHHPHHHHSWGHGGHHGWHHHH